MTTDDIIHIFSIWLLHHLPAVARHSQAKLYPSELVMIGTPGYVLLCVRFCL